MRLGFTEVILIAIFLIIAIKWGAKLFSSGDNFDNSASLSETGKSKSFSQDIYIAIEEFAHLCRYCKQATGWPYEDRDHATIIVTQTDSSTKLELTCRGDSIACCLPQEYKWLRNENDLNQIRYVTNNATGYVVENYGSNIPTDGDSLFYFYKKGDPHAVGQQLWTENNGTIVGMLIKLQ